VISATEADTDTDAGAGHVVSEEAEEDVPTVVQPLIEKSSASKGNVLIAAVHSRSMDVDISMVGGEGC
jgi:hypothetical protein